MFGDFTLFAFQLMNTARKILMKLLLTDLAVSGYQIYCISNSPSGEMTVNRATNINKEQTFRKI